MAGYPARHADKEVSVVTSLVSAASSYVEVVDSDGQFKKLLNSDFKNILTALSTKTMLDAGSLASAGSSQTDAAAIINSVTSVTGADGTKGVKLPVSSAGDFRLVYNSVATNGLPVYPGTSGTINGGSANAAVTIEGKTLAILVNTDGTNWAAIYTANT